MSARFLRDPVLEDWAISHGFGVRGAREPAGLVRPRQVHGRAVAEATAHGPRPLEADAIVSGDPSLPVAVVTADCVPVLVAARSGRWVAAVHAGWRGLAAGVVEAGIDALRERAAGEALRAALGPYIRPCCYEVDEPVLAGLAARFGDALEAALHPARAGHARVDLGVLVRLDLERAGIAPQATGGAAAACTRCDAQRFHSYRRDGPRAGRLVHFVHAREP